VIEAGNPADRERLLPMLERHVAVWGAAPRQLAADGGYASRETLAQPIPFGAHDAFVWTMRRGDVPPEQLLNGGQ
jgi:transposase, IS5 family